MAETHRTFPLCVYVRWSDDDEPYLIADLTAEDAAHGERVGIYELKDTQVKCVVHTWE